MIKKLFSCVCLVLSCFILFSSCDKTLIGKTLPEVDFNNVTDVQLIYKQNVYNIKLSYCSGILTITFIDTDSSLYGITYKVSSQVCQVSYGDISHDTPVENLPNTFFPRVIYKFISDFGGIIPTENYNSQRNCSYISRNVFNTPVTLEVYENENNTSYSLHIT